MTRYAKREGTKKITVSLVLSEPVVRYIRRVAGRSGDSISSVADELLREAIFGTKFEKAG